MDINKLVTDLINKKLRSKWKPEYEELAIYNSKPKSDFSEEYQARMAEVQKDFDKNYLGK